jgi:hypothetical protein
MTNIEESVKDLVPNEIKNLEDGNYTLTKTETSRYGFVGVGDTVTGLVEIVERDNKPCVKVWNKDYNGRDRDASYIRTSPIVEVLDTTATSVVFRTEGGVYKLEKHNG